MAPILSWPDATSLATRAACGPENEKSRRAAMPRSNTSRCSGSASTDCSMCRSCTRAGSSPASALLRKSACFWLLPSRQTRSPLSSTWCSRSAMRLAGSALPSSAGPSACPARARRALRFCCSVFQTLAGAFTFWLSSACRAGRWQCRGTGTAGTPPQTSVPQMASRPTPHP